ncbi:ABC transporter ATP-binding protein [Micromonospora endolithica]|uniref:ATP-binding cassette domain-containing protein n=1 Tax=Micromonospora endolithica TaxID=230091 RepID=A0A3A9ZNJ7_9ACTN|nr:ATP-binding cassette domain-containing protein [Micromonospora endolithica]RKN49067.1 ATP-binding cassette domain-containing protein [Micromonospora endolithica]TWJ23213.1 ABC-2 type transport system ATP-binding protein/heme exporter protein A [Micromonospora endolithica]
MLLLDGAGRTFGRRPVFSGLDLEVSPGTRLLLTGGNGAGKTTLLRCLAGTLTLSAGRATIAGWAVGSPEARRLVGVALAPEQTLCGRLSAHDNLMLVARMRLPAREAAPAVARLEEEFAIAEYARLPAQRCSAGTRARISARVPCSVARRSCCWTNPDGPWTPPRGHCSGPPWTGGPN